ncbi:DNA damage response [Physcia stellaris]|nr:DNA damage response [Physcia stellaris]
MATVDDAISMQSRPPLRQQGSVSAGRAVEPSRWTRNNPAVTDDEPKPPPLGFKKNTNAISSLLELFEVPKQNQTPEEESTLQDVDIVVVPRDFSDLDSACLHRSTTHQEQPQIASKISKMKEFQAKSVLAHNGRKTARNIEKDIGAGAHTIATEQQGHRDPNVSHEPGALFETPEAPKDSTHWLKDLNNSVKKGRILLLRSRHKTLPQEVSVKSVAEFLIKELMEARSHCSKRPIVFIGHDVGIIAIEEALMAFPNVFPGVLIFSRTAGVIFLSSPAQKTNAETGQGLNYLDSAPRMSSDSVSFHYTELKNPQYVFQHLEKLQTTLKEAEKSALKELERPDLYGPYVGPSAITLSRIQYLGKIQSANDPIYLKIVKTITSCVDCYQLLSAAAFGKDGTLRSILNRGVNKNTQDRIGNTALHLAAVSGNLTILQTLLEVYQANVAIQNSAGCSALYLAVDVESKQPDIITFLLRRGARWKDSHKDRSRLSKLSSRPEVSTAIRKLLNIPPLVEGPQKTHNAKGNRLPTAPVSPSARGACKAFRAVVAEFFQFEGQEEFLVKDLSVHNLLYKNGPNKTLEKARERAAFPIISEAGMTEQQISECSQCQWYHLPANNDLLTWMRIEDNSMVECQHEGSTPWSYFMRPQARKIRKVSTAIVKFSAYTVAIPDDISIFNHGRRKTVSLFERRGRISQRISVPSETVACRCDEHLISLIIMYFRAPNNVIRIRSSYEAPSVDTYPILRLIKAQTNLTASRKADIPKYISTKQNTIVTSFPRKWTEPDGEHEDDVLDRVLQYLRADKSRPPITSPLDLADIITTFCTNIFDRSSTMTQLRLHDLFECSIGAVAHREMRLFTTFSEACATNPHPHGRASESETAQNMMRKMKSISNIDNEIESLKEIKDIRDEIRMIIKILKDQAMSLAEMDHLLENLDEVTQSRRVSSLRLLEPVKDSYRSHRVTRHSFSAAMESARGMVEPVENISQEGRSKLDINIWEFEKMLRDADAVEDALNHLLDLKQKQANAMEATYARLAAVATGKQGKTILFFTFVTILFGSLSFVAAFFALNVGSFPKGPDGTTTVWQIRHILGLVGKKRIVSAVLKFQLTLEVGISESLGDPNWQYRSFIV